MMSYGMEYPMEYPKEYPLGSAVLGALDVTPPNRFLMTRDIGLTEKIITSM